MGRVTRGTIKFSRILIELLVEISEADFRTLLLIRTLYLWDDPAGWMNRQPRSAITRRATRARRSGESMVHRAAGERDEKGTHDGHHGPSEDREKDTGDMQTD